MAGKVKVHDQAGHERLVHPVDAREIVAHGGSYPPGQPQVPEPVGRPKLTHPAEVKVAVPVVAEAAPETVEDAPKKAGRPPKK